MKPEIIRRLLPYPPPQARKRTRASIDQETNGMTATRRNVMTQDAASGSVLATESAIAQPARVGINDPQAAALDCVHSTAKAQAATKNFTEQHSA